MNGLNLSVDAGRKCEVIGLGLAEFGGEIGGFLDKMGYASGPVEVRGIVERCLTLWLMDGGGDAEEFLDFNGYSAGEVRAIARQAIQQFSRRAPARWGVKMDTMGLAASSRCC